MKHYIPRLVTETINTRLQNMPAVAILGPRQCGKTTLTRFIIKARDDTVYLDLERKSDLNKLRDPEAFFSLNENKLICLDEIQRVPELFSDIRSKIDRDQRNGQFLILGSASPKLIRQTSETLAGRISYLELTPFCEPEIAPKNTRAMRTLWLRGGFPRSYLARDDQTSFDWRQDFIRTFLERDVPQLGFKIPAAKLERFWQMCAHVHGQLLNRSNIGKSLGVSHHTIDTYIGILEDVYLARTLRPYHATLKKRLVKTPKLYLRDTGLLHALLDIRSHNSLLGHPGYGVSWEGFAIENILAANPGWRPYFYRSASGAEIDLLLEKGTRKIALEIKASTAPTVSRGFWNALDDLQIDKAFIIAPVGENYPYKNGVDVVPLQSMAGRIE